MTNILRPSFEELGLLFEALEHCEQLKKLDMSGNAFKEEAFKKLNNSLQGLYSLRSLTLRDCKLGEDSTQLKSFFTVLREMQILEEIDISDNKIGEYGAKLM